MAEAINIHAVVTGLKQASSENDIFVYSRALAEELSPMAITQLILEGAIAMQVVRTKAATMPTQDFLLARSRASEVMEEARSYLGVSRTLVDLLQEEVRYVVDKALNDTGAPLEEEIEVSRRQVENEEMKISPKAIRRANDAVRNRSRN